MVRWLVMLSAMLLAQCVAGAATYYVHPDGDNANAGTGRTPDAAWRSIDRGQPTTLVKAAAAGDTTVYVVKAMQFPASGRVRIGDAEVTYTGRTLFSLTGCEGTPDAPAKAKVTCDGAGPPGPGDTVVVLGGVYYQPITSPPPAGGKVRVAVVEIHSGGSLDQPIVFKGENLPVVDGRNEMIAWNILASHVRVEGFDIRRGGIAVEHSRNIAILNCRVHEGNRGISISYSRDVEVAGNLLYDFQGAWTAHNIVLGRCQNARVHHNTIVASTYYGVRLYGGSGYRITNNLIAWCRFGIIVREKDKMPADVTIRDNNIWRCGKVIWLQRDDEGTNFYTGLSGDEPADLHEEPMIVQWDPRRENFLAPHPSSPCVKDGRAWIGAVAPAGPYPQAGNRAGENLVFNPSFEAGLWGWSISQWLPSQPGEAGSEITESDAADGPRCILMYDELPKGRAALRLQSMNFRYTRGQPVTISFLAKAAADGTRLGVGLTFPSWQNKSGIGSRVKLSTQWKRYTVTLTPLVRFPDVATVTFTTYRGRYWIDAVKVEEGDTATAFSPTMEFVPDDYLGMLVPPGEPLSGRVINRLGRAVSGRMTWTLEAPFAGRVAGGERTFTAKELAPLKIELPRRLTGGVFLLRYEFIDEASKRIGRGKLRFSIGKPPKRGRNHYFFAATPGYSPTQPGELLDRQYRALEALGLGTLHVYAGYKRINEMLWSGRFAGMLDSSERAHLAWLITPSDATALTGKGTWAPGPGNVGPEAIEVKREDLGGGRVTAAQLDAWAKAIRMLALRFKGRIRFWEVLNEPNCFLSGEEYAKVFDVTSRTLRSADPQAVIIAGSVVNAPRKDLYNATMAAAPGTFDAFSYHPYRFGLKNPESERQSYRRDLLATKEDLAKAGHKVPVFLTEEGMGPTLNETRCIGRLLTYSANVRLPKWGEGEILQAQYAARMYATALGEGCMGYSYHVLGGLVQDVLMNPSLTLKALHTMDCLLGDADPLGQLEIGRDYIAYVFAVGLPLGGAKRRDVVVAIWPKDSEYAQPVAVPLDGRADISAVNIFGMPMPLERTRDGGRTLKLGRELIYLTLANSSPDAARTLVRKAFVGLHSRPGR